MMMMQYTNCVVKAHKVQTVKLTLYKYKSWWHVRCEIELDYKRSSSAILGCRERENFLIILIKKFIDLFF